MRPTCRPRCSRERPATGNPRPGPPRPPRVTVRFAFLHIGKAAGTAIRAAIAQHNAARPAAPVTVFTHETRLPDICRDHPDTAATFFVRDPVERFVSGFNSRLRCGRPRYDVAWTDAERVAFTRFPTANALGEALAPGRPEWPAAQAAMQAIYHARLGLQHYLHSPAFLDAHRERIAFIGMTSAFDRDFARFKRCVGMDAAIAVPRDPVGAHRNPEALDARLSAVAERNLRAWYAQDDAIYRWCVARRAALLDGPGMPPAGAG